MDILNTLGTNCGGNFEEPFGSKKTSVYWTLHISLGLHNCETIYFEPRWWLYMNAVYAYTKGSWFCLGLS